MRHSERWVLTSMRLGVRPCVFFSSVRAFSCCLYVRCSFVISLFTAVIFLHSYLHDFSFCFVCGISCWMTIYILVYILVHWRNHLQLSVFIVNCHCLPLEWFSISNILNESAIAMISAECPEVFGEFSLDRLHRDCSASLSSRSPWHRSFPCCF